MPIAILVLALVAYAYVLIALPSLRKPALTGGAVIAAIVAASLFLSRPQTIVIAPDALTLDQVAFERTTRGATVTGRVQNASGYRLRDMTLALRLHDCADPEAEAATCPVIGESTAIARPDVPAGQIRAFSAHFAFAGVPPVVGTLRWDMTITATRATGA
jgi:hypothetical protein